MKLEFFFHLIVFSSLILCVDSFDVPQNINEGCHDGFSYESLEECGCACFQVFTRKQCGSKGTAINFKSIYVNHDEFKIIRNGTLLLSGPLYDVNNGSKNSFALNTYFNLYEVATILCYPVQKSMNNCSKELLPVNDIEFFKVNRTAFDRFERKYYPVNAYVKNRKGITVCKSSELRCQDGNGFESIEQCKCYCFIQDGVTTPRCAQSEWEIIRYKSMVFKRNEFVLKWGILRVKNLPQFKETRFTKKQFYQFENGSAVLCLPVHESIQDCDRIRIRLSDVFFSLHDRSIYVRQYDRKYTVDLYTTYKDIVVICQDENHYITQRLKIIGYCTSFFSLLFTFLVGLKTFNHQTNFALLCYVIMLCFSNLCNAIAALFVTDKNHKYFCPLIPLFEQFSFLSALIWMNIQGYVLTAAFTKGQIPKLGKSISKKHYFVYFVCGWGIPFLISGITYTMEVIDVPVLKPTFIKLCRFELNYAVSYLYYHGPVCISLALNVVFFTIIFVRVKKLAKDASSVNKDTTRQLYCMVFKLIITMGFCHVTTLIHWGIRIWGSIWDYLDIVSTYQGLFILLVYTCRKKTFKMFKMDSSKSS